MKENGKLRGAIARAFALVEGHPDCAELTEWPTNKCWKRLPSGEICGKVGSCIHNWKPSRFGAK